MQNIVVKFIMWLLPSSSHCRSSVSVYSTIYSVHADPQPLSIINFFQSATSKNIKIFYENLIIVAETHVYMKASSATRQQMFGVHPLK